MASEDLAASDVTTLYIAGGFGNYLNKRSAAKIGFLPRELAARSKPVGNVALSGAAMLLLDCRSEATLGDFIRKTKVLELSSDPIFSEKYMISMLFQEIE